jgi:L-ascorbate metabolism protein UlaG (beta-lactamase superfamily)
MEIKYLGHSSFFIKTKNSRIVTDPFDTQEVGLNFPKVEADIVTVSHAHKDHSNTSAVKGNPLIINWPGEFEKQQVRIIGYQTFHDSKSGAERGENVMYKIDDGEITVLHCGDLGHQIPPSLLDEIGSVDVLLLPTGGVYTLNPHEASKVVNQVEPYFVIPMHFQTEGLNSAVFKDLSPNEAFLKEMGAEEVRPIDKFIIKKDQLTEGSTSVVLLSV